MDQAVVEIAWKEFAGDVAGKVIGKLDAIQGASAQVARTSAEMGGAIEKGLGFLKAAGVIAGLAAAANELKKFDDATRKYAAGLNDVALSARVSADAYQALVATQDKLGNSEDRTRASLGQLNAKILEAGNGGKSASEAFERLGVKLVDSTGRARGTGDVLQDVAAGLLRMTDADERAAAAKDLLAVSGTRADATLRSFALGLGETERRAHDAGLIIGGEAREAAEKLEKQSNQTAIAVRAFYAQIAMPIELKALEAVETLVIRLQGAYNRANEAAQRFAAGAVAAASEGQIAALQKKIASAQASLDKPNFIERTLRSEGSTAAIQADIAAWQGELAKLQGQAAAAKAQAEAVTTGAVNRMIGRPQGPPDLRPAELADPTTAIINRALGSSDLPSPPGVTQTDFGNRPVAATGGGSGGGGRDRIGENLRQVQAQAQAAWKAFEEMRGGQGLALKDLEAQVNLGKNIADELAKLGKYDANDPRLEDLKKSVTERERGEAALRKYVEAGRDAEAIERQSGNGVAYLREETERLNRALDSGRLSYEGYAVAIRDARVKAEEMRLTQAAQSDGVEGFIAGFQLAALQAQKAGRMGELGARAYAEGFGLAKSAIDELADSGTVNLDRLGRSALKLGSDIAFAIAQAQILQAVGVGGGGGGGGSFGGIGGFLSGLLGLGGGGGMAAAGTAGSPFFGPIIPPGFANGGDPPVGIPSIVGERGPEWFVPKTAGTVLNQQQMAALGVGRQQPAIIYLTGDTDLVRVAAEGAAVKVVNSAEPRIVGRSVRQSAKLAPAAVARHTAAREGEWRLQGA